MAVPGLLPRILWDVDVHTSWHGMGTSIHDFQLRGSRICLMAIQTDPGSALCELHKTLNIAKCCATEVLEIACPFGDHRQTAVARPAHTVLIPLSALDPSRGRH